MRKVFEAVGIDWYPAQGMIDAVKWKPFVAEDYWTIPENEEGKAQYWKKLLDYRIDFYPGDKVT